MQKEAEIRELVMRSIPGAHVKIESDHAKIHIESKLNGEMISGLARFQDDTNMTVTAGRSGTGITIIIQDK